MQNKLPIICATDSSTDIGEIASNNRFGYACLTTDSNSFYEFVIKLLNKELRSTMGQNAYNYLVKEYNVEISYKKIINKIYEQ
jgi:glycosyltransferase involved in cell wall biosynthesis